ncbi:MAG: hypothetical protein IJ938_05575 [Clostridia bacterium]|nr:hypothetical protein [Clostridia bacterium]MBR2874493.1 hypothetical protein [Clostridia bacterium]
MSNFRDFNQTEKENLSKEEQKIERIIERYKDKSENELKSEFISRYEEEKRRGNMDDKKLDEISSVLSRFITKEQKQKLDKIIDEMKEND